MPRRQDRPRPDVIRTPPRRPEAPRTEVLRRVPAQVDRRANAWSTDAPVTEVLPYVQRPPRSAAGLHTEALHRVVCWHGDHLRTQALRVVPEHADGLRPTSRPAPEAPGDARDDAPGDRRAGRRPRRTPRPGSSLPDDQRPRWRPGERLEHLFEERCDATPHHLAVEPETGRR